VLHTAEGDRREKANGELAVKLERLYEAKVGKLTRKAKGLEALLNDRIVRSEDDAVMHSKGLKEVRRGRKWVYI